jgi:hypothetical protein
MPNGAGPHGGWYRMRVPTRIRKPIGEHADVHAAAHSVSCRGSDADASAGCISFGMLHQLQMAAAVRCGPEAWFLLSFFLCYRCFFFSHLLIYKEHLTTSSKTQKNMHSNAELVHHNSAQAPPIAAVGVSVHAQSQMLGVVGGVGGAVAQVSKIQTVGQLDASVIKAKREQMKEVRNQVLFDSPAIKVTYGNITVSSKNKSWCCYLGKCLPCFAPIEEKIITSKDFGTASSIKLTEVSCLPFLQRSVSLTYVLTQQFHCCECPPGSKALLMFQDKKGKKHYVNLPPSDKTAAKEAIMDAFETVELRGTDAEDMV